MNYNAHIPDDRSLSDGLMSVFYRGQENPDSGLSVVTREMNVFCSSYASEVIQARLNDGSELLVHSKYAGDTEPWGHHRGIEYEAQVYDHVLRHIPVTVPKFYGLYEDSRTGNSWLFIEHIHDALRLYTTTDAIVEAARWLGRFHAISAVRIGLSETKFLAEYDDSYFHYWVSRTAEYAAHLGPEFNWVKRICDHFIENIGAISLSGLTITHGEFYPKNILVKSNEIYPVDWESAVVARGEIDLASLVEGWNKETIERCEEAYVNTRWPDGAPSDFEEVFKLSNLFWSLRWLGDRDDWELDDFAELYFSRLRSEARSQNLI